MITSVMGAPHVPMKWEATDVYAISSPQITMVVLYTLTTMHMLFQLHNSDVTAITRVLLTLYAGTRTVMQTGSAVVMPMVLIAVGGSFIVTLVVTIVVGLVCVKLRKTKKTDTRYC